MMPYSEPTKIITENATEWRVDDYLHRLDGPALVARDGSEYWYHWGELHRLDGPALIYPNGTQCWYHHDELHRLDGPAVTHANGAKHWFQHGRHHRLDGPASIYVSGGREWYRDGELVPVVELEPNVILIQTQKLKRSSYRSMKKIGVNTYRIDDEDLCILRLTHLVVCAGSE